jgi:hypothetical protein
MAVQGKPLPAVAARKEGEALHQIWDLDDFFLDRVLHQLRFIVNVEFAHQIKLVRLHRFHAQVQITRDFFH